MEQGDEGKNTKQLIDRIVESTGGETAQTDKLSVDPVTQNKADERVKKLKNIIAEKEKEIISLRSELKKSLRKSEASCSLCKRTIAKQDFVSAETQTEDIDVTVDIQAKSLCEWVNSNSEIGQVSIADQVRDAAESALQQSGFVYEETTGMYYDYKTGYYYDAERGLYYNGSTGTYYYYNAETQSYLIHSQVEVASNMQAGQKRNRNSRKAKVKKKAKVKEGDASKVESDKDPSEEGECFSSGSSSESPFDSDASSWESEEETPEQLEEEEVVDAVQYPPCMRIIVKETDLPDLKVGNLFIVTCQGGVLGKEVEHVVYLPDIKVSKYHARFTYEDGKYMICDLGSRNGTFLNSKRLSVAKQESDPQEVVHASIVQVGGTKLLCHIHPGTKTCGHCEPGLVMEGDQSAGKGSTAVTTNKEKERRMELRNIRRRYGLQSTEVNSAVLKMEGYEDRAQERRVKVGSQVHGAKTEVASLDEAVRTSNKGYQLLSKMGWKEGQGLGKENTGQTEPIPLESRVGREGLGAVAPVAVVETAVERRKRERWKKAQERFSTTS